MMGVSKGTRLNPLHCGAVVASWTARSCLHGCRKFQSPSLRGSGRFEFGLRALVIRSHEFQSPSLRGSGRFAGT